MPWDSMTGLVVGTLAFAAPALAADVTVEVTDLRSGLGVVRVAVCPESSFTRPDCPYTATAPAGEVVVVRDVPAGVYAVQAFHDENNDGNLNRRGFRPSEGLGFSRDAPLRMGPPRFSDAAVQINGSGRLTLSMRYY
ncbi:uncharacterized protein (DUF2141 family) [Hasllibacter halocynthiae]|uniref:Uncharacterized protein (DUF2141 family) n=1 Tax=Hasllibacter halocynthiae TaxID=595589 RepID=A0A2T0X2F5_9RHOB|nr:DUF2141 domain-containing protein [Hasllibacter halocynthiae]PRY93087.1 uncharacterized protein (DUF2141 family) [Hasllibacter halocynthiae]